MIIDIESALWDVRINKCVVEVDYYDLDLNSFTISVQCPEIII